MSVRIKNPRSFLFQTLAILLVPTAASIAFASDREI